MKKLVYHKLAYLDLDIIKNYFNLQSSGLGEKFITDLKSELDKLKLFDSLGIEIDEFSRRLVFKKNYHIYYEFNDTIIKILRVIDARRDF
jgi:plasmid stabilization system protein ParE